MFSFKSFVVLEAGDNPYQFETEYAEPTEASYVFHDGKHRYSAAITHFVPRGQTKEDHANVEFGLVAHDDDGDVYHRHDITGSAGESAGRILSTIHNIIKQHVVRHPILKTVTFTSENDEPSRASLYKRYTHKLGGTTVRGAHNNIHKIPADAYRSSK